MVLHNLLRGFEGLLALHWFSTDYHFTASIFAYPTVLDYCKEPILKAADAPRNSPHHIFFFPFEGILPAE